MGSWRGVFSREGKWGRSIFGAEDANEELVEDDDAVEEEVEEEVVLEEQAGVLNGALAFDIIHSDDLWRRILEFV